VATVEHDIIYEQVTRDELRTEVDRYACERLGMSGEDFLTRWRAGELDEFSPTVSRIAVLARLLID
jgi:hypothetical protein